MKIDEETLLLMGVSALVAMIAAAARYVHNLSEKVNQFHLPSFLGHMFVGMVIGVFTGFTTEHFEIVGFIQYAFIGGAAFSSREIAITIPKLYVAALNRVAPVKKK